MSKPKKDPRFQKNLNRLGQSLHGYSFVVATQDILNPDFSDSFAYSPLSLEVEEDNFDPGPLESPPIKAA